MRPLLLALAAGLLVLPVPPATAAAPAAPDARFKALYTREQEWWQTQDAGGEDDERIAAHLPDVTPAAQAQRLAYLRDVRRQLDAIPAARLGRAAQVDYAVYRFDLDTRIAALAARGYEMPLNSDSSPWGDLGYVARAPFRSEADYRNWITQLHELPRFLDQQIANLRAGLARGFTPPRITLAGRDTPIRQVVDAKTPEDSLFYIPFARMPANIPAARQAALRQEARVAIETQVKPAYAALLAFFRDEYVPGARTTLAAEALPDGKAYYAAQIRGFTTLDLTPDQIHATGLAEIARIRAEMQGVMRAAGFTGDLPAFLAFLRTDRQFYVATPQALLDRAAWTAKEVDGVIGQYIGHLPRRRFGIVPVPDDLAAFYTAGRGGPGQYLLNTYDLPARPLYQLTALTLHESAPGHAFQMPLAAENRDQPKFRQNLYISAYGEGWALYCERLGEDMGLYHTPYERFGMLSYQAWRAARLVVDTGIHAKGWSRDRALAYLRDNTALSEREITTEVDRYISWPGQALSYYLGMMAIRDARAKAERALGAKFNIRAFHDTVLELGSVPLPILTARIDRFIAEGGKGPYPDEE
jgi:uncharacterized protein (DUF885 family)